MFTLNNKKMGGFTLIEMMVSIALFAIVMVMSMGAILSIVAANKKAQALNSVMTNLNFAVDSMSRDIKTGYNYHCGPHIPFPKPRTSCTSGGSNDYSLQLLMELIRHTVSRWCIYKTTPLLSYVPITAPEVTIIQV